MKAEIAVLHVLGDKGHYLLENSLNNDHHLNLYFDSNQNTIYKKIQKCKYIF